ncbi:hypothetical protein JCGZ_13285 [Jatropha curcas]|uniref:Uncharacterized protein n=1 Tax=Jatropha curcas TaxID=180498 RepID=A0A067KJC2_JATCU|nr:hypothetical protein JCGZ_13285 [Jatropha curcas]
MHRSSSTSRAADELSVNFSSDDNIVSPVKTLSSTDLPIYKSSSDASKKEIGLHQKSVGENAVHLIPLILLLCALILWLFSYPIKA